MCIRDRHWGIPCGYSVACCYLAGCQKFPGAIRKRETDNQWRKGIGSCFRFYFCLLYTSGYLIMTDAWFNEYMFRLVVETKYASKKALEMCIRDRNWLKRGMIHPSIS